MCIDQRQFWIEDKVRVIKTSGRISMYRLLIDGSGVKWMFRTSELFWECRLLSFSLSGWEDYGDM